MSKINVHIPQRIESESVSQYKARRIASRIQFIAMTQPANRVNSSALGTTHVQHVTNQARLAPLPEECKGRLQ